MSLRLMLRSLVVLGAGIATTTSAAGQQEPLPNKYREACPDYVSYAAHPQ